MRILDLWSLHYENFVIQIRGTDEEAEKLSKALHQKFPGKTFCIFITNERGENDRSNT